LSRGTADHHRTEAFQRLKLSKIHLTPRLLERCPRRVGRQFDSLWAPVEELAQQVGAQSLRRQELEAVAFISLTDLVEEPLRALHVVGHLLDHLLGCQGAPQGGWLSDGHALSPPWVEIGQQVPALFKLGYAIDQIAAANPRQYFAQSLAWYIQNRRRLNVADPLIERLLRQTLFSENFCWRTLLSSQK